MKPWSSFTPSRSIRSSTGPTSSTPSSRAVRALVLVQFGIARFREVSNTLAERVIIRDQIARASSTPSASLRVAADGKLFVALDDADSARLAEDLSSANGKILRLNPDGTTPDDQAGGSPLLLVCVPLPAWFRLAPDVTSALDRRPRSSRLESPQRRGDG